MAIIYSYPTVDPVREDLVLGTDVSSSNKATKNFTIQSIIDLVTVATGDLQTVLTLGNVATGFDINLTNSSFIGGGFRTVGGIVISSTTGTGFTNITSTSLTGTVATAAQPNITSLGSLTALVLDGPISGTNLITSSNLAGAQNDNVVSTLAIKTYVDNQVGLFDTLQEVLANGNTTSGSNIAVSANDDITFTDTSKIILGTGADATIEHDGTDLKITNTEGKTTISNSSGDIDITATAATKKTIINGKAGVDLQFDGSKKLETLTGGAKVTGAFEATAAGTFVNLLNSGTYQDSSGDVGTAGQILSSTATGTNWVTEVPLYNWSLEGTAIPSGAAVTVTDGTNITTTWDAANYDLSIAVTGLPDGTGAANQVTFWSDTDTLTGAAGFTFAGGATGQVTVAGILQAGTLSDGTFSGSAGTYTGGVSITSTDFVGALTGNASTATQLAVSGAITMTGDVTLTGTYDYTQGGPMTLATSIADSKIMGKLLDSYSPGSAGTLAATDTILQAFTKLQASITATSGLTYEGTWNANTDTPALSGTTPNNGIFYIVSVAGNTDLSGITDWKVGDWAIYVSNGSATDGWQKLDQTNEVLGSGAANKITKWTGTNTLGTGLIEDDGTTVTIGNSGNLIVQGNTTFGDANSDTATIKGPAYFESTIQLNTGIGLGSTPSYGSVGQVLTSGGGTAGTATWTTPTTGTVTSVGLTETGDALTITNSPITSSGDINIAGAGTASQYINGVLDLVTFPTVDNYVSWTADSDEGTDITVTSGFNLKFTGAVTAGGAGIATDSAVSANEMTIGLVNAGGTPGATTFYRGDGQWSVPVGTKTETLAEVLGNGNTTGGTDIAVSAADDITFTDTSKALFGTGSDLQVYHTGVDAFIKNDTGQLIIRADQLRVLNNANSEQILHGDANGAVTLYYDNSIKLATTSTGVSVTGDGDFSGQIFVGAQNSTFAENNLRFLSAGGAYIDHAVTSQDINFRVSNSSSLDTTAMIIKSDGDVEFKDDVEIDGNLTVDGSIIHGGTGNGGTYNFSDTVNAASNENIFSIQATNGAQAFTVYFTCNTTGVSVAKVYTVVHSYGTTVVYNKLVDSGPYGGVAADDFTPTFTGATDTVTCNIANLSSTNLNIVTTVVLGGSPTALTVTAL